MYINCKSEYLNVFKHSCGTQHFNVLICLQPKGNVYGSFGVFCPSSRIECVDLLATEDILIDWKMEMYLNFTHIDIMNRLNLFYEKMGYMERLAGDIYTIDATPEHLELERYDRMLLLCRSNHELITMPSASFSY